MADLARAAILHGETWRRPRSDLEDVRVGMNLIRNLKSTIGDPAVDQDPALLFLYRIALKQFPDQYSWTQRVGRTLVLFQDLPGSIPRLAGYDPSAQFHSATGITLEQFLWCVVAILAVSLRQPTFTSKQVIDHELPSLAPVINKTTVEATLDMVAASFERLRREARTELAGIEDSPAQTFAFNPLVTHPVINLPHDRGYLVPLPRLLLRRLVDAPYYVLLDKDHANFTEWLGPAFEEYVGWLLRPSCGDRLHGEITYGKTKAKSPEWIIDEGEDGFALLECKTKRIPKREKTIAPIADLHASFAQVYGAGLKQLHRFISDVPNHDELAHLKHRQLEPFIVVLDPLYLANSPIFEKARLRAHTDLNIPPDFSPQVVTIEGLEMLAGTLASASLSRISRAKRADVRQTWNDWTTEAKTVGGEPNARLDARYDALMEGFLPDDRPRVPTGKIAPL
jgi:hypothetical protein